MAMSIHFCICQALAEPLRRTLYPPPKSPQPTAALTAQLSPVDCLSQSHGLFLSFSGYQAGSGVSECRSPCCAYYSYLSHCKGHTSKTCWFAPPIPRCPSTKKQTMKMWYIYTMEYYFLKYFLLRIFLNYISNAIPKVHHTLPPHSTMEY